jgi:hypothetical protein
VELGAETRRFICYAKRSTLVDQVLAFPAPVTEGRHYVVTTDFSYEGTSAILSGGVIQMREESEYCALFIMRLALFPNLRKIILLLGVRL